MVDVVMHQGFLGVTDRAFDGLQLLGNVQASALIFQHRNDAFEMAFGSFQPFDNVRV
jgi:hypothetical protein